MLCSISTLTKVSVCKWSLSTASNEVIFKELIDIDDILSQNNIQLIKRDLQLILDTYNNFKELTEFFEKYRIWKKMKK